MLHRYHREILELIKGHSGKPTQHTFLDGYMGNSHPRYAINAPTMRRIAGSWMKAHSEMNAEEFSKMLTSMIAGESSTEKCMAGVLLDASRPHQRTFPPAHFERWLDHLVGWAEIDSVCTGAYTVMEIPKQWKSWKKLLSGFSRSKNINKRRASIVLLCSPLRSSRNESLMSAAFQNVTRLKAEKEILITKAISWVLRSGVKYHSDLVEKYIALNQDALPRVALRETRTKLKTGRKTKPKPKPKKS